MSEVSVQPSPKQPKTNAEAEMRRRIRDFMRLREFHPELQKFLVDEGAAGMLRDSNKEHGLVNMTGASSNFTPAELPEAFLTTESYGLIWRLLKRGPVEIEIDLKNTFSPGEVEVYNTVAEIPGSEKPDEVVIIGGHIDSWDLGTGATDNGTGIMAVLEAARALKAVGVKPKRTIRFVLFSGEEEGLHGSRAYVKGHEKEMSKISGVLIHDMGTGRVKSIGLQGRYDLREIMENVVEPFKEAVNLEELSMRSDDGHRSPVVPAPRRAGIRRRPGRGRVSQDAPHRKRHLRQGLSRRDQSRGEGARGVGLQRGHAAGDSAARPQAGEKRHVRQPRVSPAPREIRLGRAQARETQGQSGFRSRPMNDVFLHFLSAAERRAPDE